MDINLKIRLTEWIKFGFGFYVGKELGKAACEKITPVIKKLTKEF